MRLFDRHGCWRSQIENANLGQFPLSRSESDLLLGALRTTPDVEEFRMPLPPKQTGSCSAQGLPQILIGETV